MTNDLNLPNWIIYGANGYTSELIAREAVSQGLKPTVERSIIRCNPFSIRF